MDLVTIGMGLFQATICLILAFALHDVLKETKLAPTPVSSIMGIPWYVLAVLVLGTSIGIGGFFFIASGTSWVSQHATLIAFVVYGYCAAAIILLLISFVRFIMRKHD